MFPGLYWVGNALEIAGAPPVLALFLPLGMAFYAAFAALLYWWLSRWTMRRGWGGRQDLTSVFLLAFCWLLGEWLRGHLITGFPWNLVGYSWAFSDTMSQGAALFGAYGLSFLLVFTVSTPVMMAWRPRGQRGYWAPLLLSVGILTVQFVYGAWRLNEDTVLTDTKVRIVQANISQEDKWRPELRTANFMRHITMSAEPGSQDVDMLIWPEVAVIYFLDESPSQTAMMAQQVKPGGVVLSGSLRREVDASGKRHHFNSFVAIESDGAVRETFDKFHLVPFGEYVPLKFLFEALGIEKLTEGAGDYSAGPGPRVIDLPGQPSVSPLICYEVIFPGQVLPPGGRPGFLLNVTNDAWYGMSSGPYQHLMIARFRAIEEGVPMVRSASTGISAIIDAHGRILAQLNLNERGIIDSRLPKPLASPSLFARIGNLTVLLLVVMSLVLVVLANQRQNRRNMHA